MNEKVKEVIELLKEGDVLVYGEKAFELAAELESKVHFDLIDLPEIPIQLSSGQDKIKFTMPIALLSLDGFVEPHDDMHVVCISDDNDALDYVCADSYVQVC